uniref:Uncharacterized protein n=1 Tax=Arundo donax TaxID=35708 RepID=A0A0A9CA33_ARUDO
MMAKKKKNDKNKDKGVTDFLVKS